MNSAYCTDMNVVWDGSSESVEVGRLHHFLDLHSKPCQSCLLYVNVSVCLCRSVGMKLLPALPPLNAPTNNMERLSLFPSDLLWRYPAINFHSPSPTPLNNYLQMDFKTHLPATLGE